MSDTLYRRYSQSEELLGHMIEMGQLSAFIEDVFRKEDEERLWQLYCAAGYLSGRSFEDWRTGTAENVIPQEMDRRQVDEIVKQSDSILQSFQLKDED